MSADDQVSLTAREMLLSINQGMKEIYENIGKHEGAFDKFARQFNCLSESVRHHHESEADVVIKLDQVRTEANERHKVFNERLSSVEDAIIKSRVRWGVATIIFGGLTAIAGGIAYIVSTIGVKQIFDYFIKAFAGS